MRHLTTMLGLALAVTACAPQDGDGDGVPASLDCDDSDFSVYPGAVEVCDGVDNDCNEVVDDEYARGGQIFFLDRDGDGFGVWEQAKVRCAAPAGYVDNSTDCSDDDADVYPGAPEFCDKVDQNCNGDLDDNAVDADAYYTDYDQDGYGGSDSAIYACEQPEGSITIGGDCDDFSAIINPEAVERCDQIDNDCNGIVDDADSLDATPWYGDKDRDGYGDPEDVIQSCYQPEYYVPEVLTGDCDDADASVNPGVREVCNDGIDNNCNGSADFCIYDNWEYGSDSMVTFTGSGSSAYYGRENSIVGDVNGDGIDDFVVAGYRGQGGACSDSGSNYCGDAVLIYGAEDIAGKSFTKSDGISFSPTSTYDYAGTSLASLGDLDGDGYADFGVGAYGDDYGGSSAGSVYIVYGSPSLGAPGDWHDLNAHAQFYETSSSSYLGYGMAGGDVDGDGYTDALMGAYRGQNGGSYSGNLYIFYGGTQRADFGSVRDLPTIYGPQSSEYFTADTGHGLGTGDFDGDGIADAIVGSSYYDNAGLYSTGRAYLFYGETDRLAGRFNAEDLASAIYTDNDDYGYLGRTSTGVGDVNGDGYDEFGSCSYGRNSYAGQCAFFYGQAERRDDRDALIYSKDVHDFQATGMGSSSYLGYYGMTGADYDQDGYAEIAIGAYRESDPNGSTLYTGGILIIPGGEEHQANYTWTSASVSSVFHDVQYAYLGNGVGAEPGDVNGDGFPDLLAGAYGASSYAGEAYIWLGGGL